MKILILAAGYATRLYPLTKHWPKPLLLVKEKPIISHTVARVEPLKGCNEILVVTNNKFFSYFQEWAAALACALPVTVLNDTTCSEDDRLGSIGDIHFVINHYPVDDDLLVIGGDNLFTFDMRGFVRFAKEKKEQVTVGLYDMQDPQQVHRYGVATLNKEKKIVCFQEKPKQSDSTLVSTCIYFLPRESLPRIKEYVAERDCHDTTGDYIKWLLVKSDVWGYEFKGEWYDIGDIITFYDASITYKD
jgi:glucose-1-phosphate thymidylyltransferase